MMRRTVAGIQRRWDNWDFISRVASVMGRPIRSCGRFVPLLIAIREVSAHPARAHYFDVSRETSTSRLNRRSRRSSRHGAPFSGETLSIVGGAPGRFGGSDHSRFIS